VFQAQGTKLELIIRIIVKHRQNLEQATIWTTQTVQLEKKSSSNYLIMCPIILSSNFSNSSCFVSVRDSTRDESTLNLTLLNVRGRTSCPRLLVEDFATLSLFLQILFQSITMILKNADGFKIKVHLLFLCIWSCRIIWLFPVTLMI
jgi:hypothetical protein